MGLHSFEACLRAVSVSWYRVGVDVVRVWAAEAGVGGKSAENANLDKGGLAIEGADEFDVGVNT